MDIMVVKKKRDYGTNGNKRNIRKISVCSVYFRLFRNLSSFSINTLLSSLPVSVAQQVLLNLPGRRTRQRTDDT